MTIQARVAIARQRLAAAGIPETEAAISARVLAQHVLGWDATRLATHSSDPEPPAFVTEFDELIERRGNHEPVAYLTGHREFWGLDFEVSPAVLIPRPDTELIIEAVLELLPDRRPLQIADVGTGSGCLAVSLMHEYAAGGAVATDISGDALEIAHRNAVRHGVQDRIVFTRTDLLEGVTGPFDVIVSNPPYVLDSDRPALQPEVRDHEPHTALFGGPDGIGLIRRLLDEAPGRLRPGGLLVFEFGLGQDDRVTEVIASTRTLDLVDIRSDLQGIPRAAVCRLAMQSS